MDTSIAEFTKNAWIWLIIVEIVLIPILAVMIYTMVSLKVGTMPNDISKAKFAYKEAFVIQFGAFINKGLGPKMKINSFRIMVTSIMTFGLIVMSYYRAQLNAALNADNIDVTLETWEDIYNSNYKVLLWYNGITSNRFKNANETTTIRKIYDEKSEPMNELGVEGSIPKILSGEYIVYLNSEPYTKTKEYPCQMIPLKTPAFRYTFTKNIYSQSLLTDSTFIYLATVLMS